MTVDERAVDESSVGSTAPIIPVPVIARYDVSVIVVTYESKSFIDGCLSALRQAASACSYQVIVVDNASLDGTAEHVESRWPEVEVIQTGWNSGFSRACNVGLRAASGRYVMLLNGDAELGPGALDQLVAAADGLAAPCIVAPHVVNSDGSDQRTARAFPTAASLLFGRRSRLSRCFPSNRFSKRYLMADYANAVEPYDVDWVSGACLLIGRNSLIRLGGPDERYFMYWEDADLCRRVHRRGGVIRCVPAARAVHAEGSSASVTSPKQNWRFHRSAYRYVVVHHLGGRWLPLRPAAAIALAGRALAVRMSYTIERRRAGPADARS